MIFLDEIILAGKEVQKWGLQAGEATSFTRTARWTTGSRDNGLNLAPVLSVVFLLAESDTRLLSPDSSVAMRL